jgi:hypothetical protein
MAKDGRATRRQYYGNCYPGFDFTHVNVVDVFKIPYL